MRIPSLRHALATGLALLLAACGGGDGGGGGGNPANPQSASVVATGTITGFGSVYVNGTRYITTGASISDDGQSMSEQDLRVGQRVTVSASINSQNGEARARSIRKEDVLEGPITSVNATESSFVVLAQVVRVTTDTSFDDGLAGFAALTPGLQVEIHGMYNAEGAIVATRIEPRRPGETDLEILGRVSALDKTLMRFNINALVVNYSGATLRDFGSGGIANDLLVEVEGNSINASGELVATEVELHESQRMSDDEDREIEGLVTRFVSATDFDVAGRPVTTTAATRYENGDAAMLALNVKVEAEGSINAAGVLVATKIQFKRGNGAGIAGLVQAVTPAASGPGGTLTVLGVLITVDSNTRVEDKDDTQLHMFRVADLAVGDYVRVRGTETAPLRLTASRLERREIESRSWVRGTVRDLAEPLFTVLGVPVVTDTGTRFEEMNRADFFANGAGRIVKAKGTAAGNQLLATEVEYEDSDDYDDDDDDHGDDDNSNDD